METSETPGTVEWETLVGSREWRVVERVELVEDPEHGLALQYTPHAIARHRFPEWFEEDYEPPRRVEDGEAGEPLRPRDIEPRGAPEEVQDRDLLNDFLRLVGGQFAPESFEEFARTHGEGARARRVRAFARKYGVLKVCEHGLPYTHPGPQADETCVPMNPEPLRVWWLYAQELSSIVGIAQRLRRGERGNAEDWARLLDETEEEEVRGLLQAGELDERGRLASYVQRWLQLADFQARFTWGDDDPTLDLLSPATSPVPLFAALARQLVSVVSGDADMTMCDGCGQPYLPNRKPRVGERHFCDECRANSVPERLRQRDWRRRQGD